MIENTFAEYNEEKQRKAKFYQSVCYSHIIENPGVTANELAKLMFCQRQTIDHYLKRLDGFTKTKKVAGFKKQVHTYYAHNQDKFDWGSMYKKAKDPKREYFEDKFRDLPEHLKEPIFTGKIDASIVRSFNEGDLDHCYTVPKRKEQKVYIGTTMDLI